MIRAYKILTKASKESKSALVRNVDVVKQGFSKKQSMKFQPRWNGISPIDRGNSGLVYRASMLALAIAMDLIGVEPF